MSEEAIVSDGISKIADLQVLSAVDTSLLVELVSVALCVPAVRQECVQVEFEVYDAKQFALHSEEVVLELLFHLLSDRWSR